MLRESARQQPPVEDAGLQDKIVTRTATICVVGLGYVGLTLASSLAHTGFRVIGVEIDREKVAEINLGRYPLHGEEPDLPEIMKAEVRAGRLTATSDFAACNRADVIVIVVQTPVDDATRAPALDALSQAIASVGANLRPQTLVVVESTIPPGTMRNVVVPGLERASGLSAVDDFFVACCPERVMPGKLLANLATCSRVVGGWTLGASEVGAAFYQTLTRGNIDITDCLTAEIVKTTENAYRDVQIAFANEVALLCENYGASVYEVRNLVNKAPYRDMHLPGAGVGGHCIPKDPWLLVANASPAANVRLVPMARAVNDSMPEHVGTLVQQAMTEHERGLRGSRIVVLGYAYLQNSDDARNSPSASLIAWLQARGADIVVHDPYVAGYQVDLAHAVKGADCLVFMVAHDAYADLNLDLLGRRMRTRALVDGRHFVKRESATLAGFSYRCVGIG